MIKLNKCRTLYKFDEAILASFLGQNQQSAEANKEETKEAQNNPEAQNDKSQTSSVTSNKAEAEKANATDSAAQKKVQAGETNPEENKSETIKKDASENPEDSSTEQQTASTQYLFFDADEFIITTYQSESGWWAGYKDTGDGNSAQKLGYFPSNYVQVIETYEMPTSNNSSFINN